MVLIKIQVFWDVTPCLLLNTSISKLAKMDCLTVKKKALHFFKTVTTHCVKCYDIQENLSVLIFLSL